jgi:two-component sensor histidine kinase
MATQYDYRGQLTRFRGGTNDDISSMMLLETEHRFGNLLTCLAAGLRCELRDTGDPDVRSLLDRFENKVQGLGQLHRTLASNLALSDEEPQAYLTRLLEVMTRSILTPINVHCKASVDSGPLSAEQCKYLARILVELVLNASKHAFPPGGGGLIDINFGLRDGVWRCLVRDNGRGFNASRVGAGSRIISGLVDALEGTLNVQSASTGTAVLIEFAADCALTGAD